MADSFNPVTPQMLDDLAALRGAWTTSQSTARAAAGGLAAMAGFEFQLTKSLVSIIRQVIEGDGRTFVEALSDIVEADRGILITQAKRTLSSSALHSALGELWSIYMLAAANTPRLLPHLRFQVASERRTLADWEGSLQRWSPGEGGAAELADFKSRLSVAVTAQPRHEAARLLISEFKDPDPFARIDRMLGRLLSAPGHALDDHVETFRLDLEALRQQSHDLELKFALWGKADQPPERVEREEDSRRAVRLGERLTMADLREGRLARRGVYDAIEQQCEAWLATDREPYKLPVFWLGGRSGCGKSAALLHLAARLHDQNPDRIILYLGERVDRIAEAVRWAAPRVREGRTLLLVLDDPYTAARQQSFARAVEEAQLEWENMRAAAPSDDRQPPGLLCCGPTEQRDAAEDQCGTHIACDGFDLPIETEEDLKELAVWYEARTGQHVIPMDGNILLVQQVFEWAKGSISEFAARFRERIQAFDDGRKDGPTFSIIARILALNRLYVDYPAEHLEALRAAEPSLDSALIRLGEEQAHLDFGATGRGGVRLTHPHLANAIYMQWFGRATDRPYRKRHLGDALGAALGQTEALPEIRHAPLWAIARLASQNEHVGRQADPLGERIDAIRTELGQVLTAIYQERVETATPLEDLPVWVALRDQLALELVPDPVPLLMAAIAAAREPARGLRLSCHKLLAAHGDYDAHRACVAACLNRLIDWRDAEGAWHDWVPLAIDIMQRSGHEAIMESIARLVATGTFLPRMPQLIFMMPELPGQAGRPVLLDWLQRTPSTQPGWSKLLQRVQEDGHCSETDAIAQRFLSAGRNDGRWAFVWQNLLDGGRVDRSTLIEDAMGWIGAGRSGFGQATDAENYGWDRVWQTLMTEMALRPEERARLLSRGYQWMREIDPDHNGWTRVWAELWSAAQASGDAARESELMVAAEVKLGLASPQLIGWSHVWNPIVDAADADVVPHLLRLGSAFLRDAPPDHLGWGFVWQKMLARSGQTMRGQLVDRGRRWLDLGLMDNPSWAFVWMDIVGPRPDFGDPLFAKCLEWLRTVPNDQLLWARIALFMLGTGDDRVATQVRPLVVGWLQTGTDNPIWFAMLKAYSKLDPDDTERAQLTRYFSGLIGDPENSGGTRGRSWEALRKLGVESHCIDGHALSILAANDSPVAICNNICGRMLRGRVAGVERADFFDHGIRLLGTAQTFSSWAWLWDSLTSEASDAELRRLAAAGRASLKQLAIDESDWARLLPRIFHIDRAIHDDEVIRNRAARWLATANPGPDWIRTWRSIGEPVALMADPATRERAIASLDPISDDRAWGLVWRGAFRHADDEQQVRLCSIARPWLEQFRKCRGWHGVWGAVHRAALAKGPAIDWLTDLGVEALKTSPSARGWHELFDALRKIVPDALEEPKILAACELWLSQPRNLPKGWLDVARWRNRIDPGVWRSPKAQKQIVEWLAATDMLAPHWTTIWTDVARRTAPGNMDAVRDSGMRWLESAQPTHRSWPFMWAGMWSSSAGVPGGRARLRALGQSWLRDQGGHKHASLVANRVRKPWAAVGKRKTPDVATGGRNALRP